MRARMHATSQGYRVLYTVLCLQVMWPQQEQEGDPAGVDDVSGGPLRGLVLPIHVLVTTCVTVVGMLL